MATLTVAERVRLYTSDDAWQEYLKTCRDAPPSTYEQVEPWAWARLQRRLKEKR